ncbi:MAG: hypothetical protein QXQ64_02630 [Candidatus Bathyarchaeia archaeon]
MWYFIASVIYLVLSLAYRLFDPIRGLVLGVFPFWMAYLLLLMTLYIAATMVFGFKTWRPRAYFDEKPVGSELRGTEK